LEKYWFSKAYNNSSIINTERRPIKAKYDYKLANKQAKTLSAFDKAEKINSSLAEKTLLFFGNAGTPTIIPLICHGPLL